MAEQKKIEEKKKTSDILKTTRTKMQEIREEKKAEIVAINMQHDARVKLQEAEERAKQAAASMNMAEYEKAQAEKQKAETAFEMCSSKLEQLRNQEYISEEDSDKIINGLLDYEEELAADFKAELNMLLQDLSMMLFKYKGNVNEIETLILEWTNDIHANYSTRGRTFREDPATGSMTDRSETPVPVHIMPYTGCPEASQLDNYLKQALKA